MSAVPQPTPGGLARVNALMAESRGAEAETLLQELLRKQPKWLDALITHGRLLRQQGRREEAEAVFRQAWTHHPGKPRSALALAGVLIETGQSGEAESILTELSRAHPTRADVLFKLGQAQQKQGRLAEAEAAFRQVWSRQPPYIMAGPALARLLTVQGDTEQAMAVWRQLLVHDPSHSDGLMGLGRACRDAGQLEEAEACFRRAWNEHPDRVYGGLELAALQISLGRYEEAEVFLASMLDRHPGHPEVLFKIASTQVKARRMEEATESFRVLWSRHPDLLKAGVSLARMLHIAERYDESVAVCQQVLASDPEHKEALLLLCEIWFKQERFDEALAFFENAAAVPEACLGVWLGLARAQARGLSVRLAIETLYQVRERYPDSPEAWLSLATLLRQSGLESDAKRVAQEAQARFVRDMRFTKWLMYQDALAGDFETVQSVLSTLPLHTPWHRLEMLRKRVGLERMQWRIDEALRTGEEIAAMTGFVTAFDHRSLATTRMIALDVNGAREALRLAAELQPGDAPNISQNFIGELVNDLWVDDEAVEAARKARADASTPGWLEVVSAFPDHTGCAVGLMVHLRQVGAFELQKMPGMGTIPRRVYQFWDSVEPPDDIQDLTASWKNANPGWDHSLLNLDAALAFLRVHCPLDVSKAFRRAVTAACKADILRLALLYVRGGVYADADDRCVKGLEPLIAGRELVLRQEYIGSIGNNFIAARAGHPVIGQALERAVEGVLRGDRESIWLTTGPGLLTRAAAQYLTADPMRLSLLGRMIAVLDVHELRAFSVSACQAAYKSSTRAWQNAEFAGPRLAKVHDA